MAELERMPMLCFYRSTFVSIGLLDRMGLAWRNISICIHFLHEMECSKVCKILFETVEENTHTVEPLNAANFRKSSGERKEKHYKTSVVRMASQRSQLTWF